VLVGYSLPTADLAIGGMVADALSRKQLPATVEVVNLEPAPVARLRRLGVPSKVIARTGGKTCVQEWSRNGRRPSGTSSAEELLTATDMLASSAATSCSSSCCALLHPWLFTNYWLAFADLLPEP
jgi:hypothetical protein